MTSAIKKRGIIIPALPARIANGIEDRLIAKAVEIKANVKEIIANTTNIYPPFYHKFYVKDNEIILA